MLAVSEAPRRSVKRPIVGKASPRLAPPLPAVGRLAEYEQAAAELGIELYPWQIIAARYATATTPFGLWLYSELCAVVARQNGKTKFVLPRIVMALKAGERTLHTAQDRALPRLSFEELIDRITDSPELAALVKPKGIRTANGTESITFRSGGRYILLAPGHGVRGHHGDLVIQDEVREQRDETLQRSMGPTTIASRNPQTIYLSNAGDDGSIILNDLRRRRDEGSTFAYLEWSAAEGRVLDDLAGWAEANPALGHGFLTLDKIEAARRTQSPAGFETEHLCRWVISMQPRLVAEATWLRCRQVVEEPKRPYMAVSMDPSGNRASAVVAWRQTNGKVGLRVVSNVTETAIDTAKLGKALSQRAMSLGVPKVSFGAWTDADLARYFNNAKAMDGREFAVAAEKFVRLIESGDLVWDEADEITEDLTWTARKIHESGAWTAVKAQDDRPITSVLAAIRAVWLASEPKPASPRVM